MIKQIQPYIGKEEAKAVYETIMSTQLSEGPKTAELEKQISNITGYYSIAVSNWTDGLILCIETLKRHKRIFNNSKIIIPNLTFVASLNSALFCSLIPVVLDVDINSGQIDPNLVEDYIRKNNDVKAIMLVDLYGSCPNLDAFNEISKKYDIAIIEDAAQAFGVYFRKSSQHSYKHIGAYCDDSVGGFSFYANKQLTCGEGGVFVTKNKQYYETALSIKQHGSLTRGTFKHENIGLNYRLDDVRATILLEQIKKMKIIFDSKKVIHDYYSLITNDMIKMFPEETINIKQNYWFSNIFVSNNIIINQLKNFLNENEIETRDCFLPLSKQECYKNLNFYNKSYPNSEYIYNHLLSLPSHPLLSISEIVKIQNLISNFLYDNI